MRISVLLALGALILQPGPAQDRKRLPLTPELREFLDQFRNAAHQQDKKGIAQLTHEKAKACSAEWLERVTAQHIRVFGKDAAVKESWHRRATPEELQRARRRSAELFWPVDPEVVVTVSFQTAEPSRTNLANLMAAKEGQKWKWVPLCQR